MGIWIRSQDKMSLVKVERIVCAGKRIINQVLCSYDADDYDLLGEYETKERAIEVLDGIQCQLSSNIEVAKTMECKISNTKEEYRQCYVFQMPER